MKSLFILTMSLSSGALAWLPHERDFFSGFFSIRGQDSQSRGRDNKIRGVNLGSQFIIEPWMARDEWADMGCGDAAAEWDCVVKLGQKKANESFLKHWKRWITEKDLDLMKEYGLNTIRVPVGYWIFEDLVAKDEHFPQGALEYVDKMVGWAADRGLYVIVDLHGAPGAQELWQPFTGQNIPEPGFFTPANFNRTSAFLEIMTKRIHTNHRYRTTGMLEVVNEPGWYREDRLLPFYATAYDRIRNVEAKLRIPKPQQLTIQFMDTQWGAGNPKTTLGNRSGIAYDNHRYLKEVFEQTKASYLNTSCHDTFGRGDNLPVVIGECSIGTPSQLEYVPEFDPSTKENREFYSQWWGIQARTYESYTGWVFWSWKTQMGADFRWSYSAAVEEGIISKKPAEAIAKGKSICPSRTG